MNLYELRELLLDSGRRIFTLKQLAKLAGMNLNAARVSAWRMVKKGLAWRVLEGRIALTEDTFIIASQLVEPSYISLTSALYLHGLLRQVPVLVECVTTRNTLSFAHLGLAYYKVHPRLFYGYEKASRGGSYIFVALPEKAVLDGLYLNRLAETTLNTVLRSLDLDRLAALSEGFKKLKSARARRVVKWVEKHAH